MENHKIKMIFKIFGSLFIVVYFIMKIFEKSFKYDFVVLALSIVIILLLSPKIKP